MEFTADQVRQAVHSLDIRQILPQGSFVLKGKHLVVDEIGYTTTSSAAVDSYYGIDGVYDNYPATFSPSMYKSLNYDVRLSVIYDFRQRLTSILAHLYSGLGGQNILESLRQSVSDDLKPLQSVLSTGEINGIRKEMKISRDSFVKEIAPVSASLDSKFGIYPGTRDDVIKNIRQGKDTLNSSIKSSLRQNLFLFTDEDVIDGAHDGLLLYLINMARFIYIDTLGKEKTIEKMIDHLPYLSFNPDKKDRNTNELMAAWRITSEEVIRYSLDVLEAMGFIVVYKNFILVINDDSLTMTLSSWKIPFFKQGESSTDWRMGFPRFFAVLEKVIPMDDTKRRAALQRALEFYSKVAGLIELLNDGLMYLETERAETVHNELNLKEKEIVALQNYKPEPVIIEYTNSHSW